MSGRVVHIGQAIVDLVMTVEAVPPAGGDVFASSSVLAAGGGFNVMAAAAREGADVVYGGGHGTGRFGDIVRSAMAQEGIRVANDPEPGQDTGFCVALIDATAERTFISTVGAEGDVTARHLDAAGAADGDVVYISGYALYHPGNAAAIEAWLPRVPEGVTVVVDASPMIGEVADHVLDAVTAKADIWTLNESEARVLHARLCAGESSPGASGMAEALARRLGATVLVRVNRAGCWIATPEAAPHRIPAFEMTPVDTNGAGDAHTGVLCAGIAAGLSLTDAVVRAAAAAAISVTRRGPATSPSRSEIDELVDTGVPTPPASA